LKVASLNRTQQQQQQQPKPSKHKYVTLQMSTFNTGCLWTAVLESLPICRWHAEQLIIAVSKLPVNQKTKCLDLYHFWHAHTYTQRDKFCFLAYLLATYAL